MARKKKGGGGRSGGLMGSIIGVVLVILAVLSFVKLPGNDSSAGIFENLRAWSDKIDEFFSRETQNLPTEWPGGGINPGGESGGGSATSAPVPTPGSIEGLMIAESANVNYDRDEWNHWVSVNGCWDVRNEVLYNQADGPVVLLDRSKNVTSDKAQACSIKSGTWVDPYTGSTFTDPGGLDIDHMIPLKYAANHGGQAWDSARKQEFANSMSGNHLLAVSASANRSKSDKGPGDWKPTEGYQCQYARDWVSVATTWGLSVTQKDADAMSAMLATC